MKTQVAMPWRPTPDRIPAHRRIIDYWTGHGYEVVCADSDPHKPFNRAAARNNAVTQTRSQVVVLADADVLPADHNQIREATRIATNSQVVRPYDVYRLLPAVAVTEPDLTAIQPIRDYEPRWRPCGITVITRTGYQQIGGYDERFGAGWGYEDAAFILACETLLAVQHIPGVLYAFNHHGSRRRDPRNRRRYWWYERAQGNPELMRRTIGLQ